MKMISILGAAAILFSSHASAQEIKRTAIPNSNFPISVAVTVPANASTVYLSGALPESIAGDTQAQTLSVLRRLQTALANEGLGFGDVVQLRVFLVGDPKLDNKLDFAGLNAAYGQFFGTTAQPAKPARTAVQVVALPLPGALVEIDLVAAKANRSTQ
jgi:enamine deaminase RidA (YjgF/YER057c/UK114 family)